MLGIETSCDDTGIGIVKNGQVMVNLVASQAGHQRFGGVLPELASREHLTTIDSLIDHALNQAKLRLADIDVIAATRGPGLIGALLVGLNYAKALSFALNKPFYAIHHLEGHIQAASNQGLKKPHLALVVSGGHTHLFDVDDGYKLVGATRDDAAGEAFDKVSRLLGLGFPGGPAISQAAEQGDPFSYPFTLPLKGQVGFDFSFSGLKTAARLAIESGQTKTEDLAASFQRIIIESLTKTTERAAKALNRQQIVVAGGVAANKSLRKAFNELANKHDWQVFFPPNDLNTDNGAMIALAGYQKALRGDAFDDFSIPAVAYLPLNQQP